MSTNASPRHYRLGCWADRLFSMQALSVHAPQGRLPLGALQPASLSAPKRAACFGCSAGAARGKKAGPKAHWRNRGGSWVVLWHGHGRKGSEAQGRDWRDRWAKAGNGWRGQGEGDRAEWRRRAASSDAGLPARGRGAAAAALRCAAPHCAACQHAAQLALVLGAAAAASSI